jgi:hypothetical protein
MAVFMPFTPCRPYDSSQSGQFFLQLSNSNQWKHRPEAEIIFGIKQIAASL